MVIHDLLGMQLSVNFHDQLWINANKINDVVSNKLLSLEFLSHEAMRPQMKPQAQFGIGLVGCLLYTSRCV